MNISFNSHFGHFAYTIVTTLEEIPTKYESLVKEALANLGFRACGSEVEKALVAGGFMDKEAKRSAVEYSDEAGKVVETTAQGKLDKIATEDGLPEMTFTVTGEHVIGESVQSRKQATEMHRQLVDKAENGDTSLLFALGLTLDTPEAEAIAKCHEFLASLRKSRK